MAYCGACGRQGEGRFCGSCGAALHQAPPPPPPSVASFPTSTVQASGPSKRSGNRVPIAIIAASVAVILVSGVAAVFQLSGSGDEGKPGAGPTLKSATPSTTASTSTAPSPTSSTTTATATSTAPTTDAEAVQALNRLADAGQREMPIDDLYVISLSLKWVGTIDTTEQPTPFTALEIWKSFQGVINNPKYGGQVKVVRDTHFGNQLAATTGGRGRAWIALLDLNLPSKASGDAWCRANFPQRGTALENVCQARKASAPFD